jgi:hypothetical protein
MYLNDTTADYYFSYLLCVNSVGLKIESSAYGGAKKIRFTWSPEKET